MPSCRASDKQTVRLAFSFAPAKGGQKQSGKNPNDCNHDEKLDESETVSFSSLRSESRVIMSMLSRLKRRILSRDDCKSPLFQHGTTALRGCELRAGPKA
jgi:hypothetical protein